MFSLSLSESILLMSPSLTLSLSVWFGLSSKSQIKEMAEQIGDAVQTNKVWKDLYCKIQFWKIQFWTIQFAKTKVRLGPLKRKKAIGQPCVGGPGLFANCSDDDDDQKTMAMTSGKSWHVPACAQHGPTCRGMEALQPEFRVEHKCNNQ